MSAKTGAQMNLYYNSGTHASPTWVEIEEVGDVSIADFSMGIAELKRRGNSFTKGLATLLQQIAIEFRLIHGVGATVFDTLRAAFLAGTVKEYAIMNGAIATSGTQGLRMFGIIEQFPWDQPLEDVSGHDVRVVCAYAEEGGSEVDPDWYTISA